jgi:hypothetical protein
MMDPIQRLANYRNVQQWQNRDWSGTARDFPWSNKTTWAELKTDDKTMNRWEGLRLFSAILLTYYFMDRSIQTVARLTQSLELLELPVL